ncbi:MULTISPECIES: acyltransferase [Actinosynnema]|uniref:acyltransferase family protein n=1 Tax=Actinosynnema TaxID=40566 RepID=UPI0020A47EC4|nr:acyltransferase [Actinosynnema pretiosum]MCP2094577.1 Peptidoglycan/LPS O-acetylase OafA/YrhL, contains acyltransferase and SGNH-hydrolase domains [Actinosynnema pretiosum]
MTNPTPTPTPAPTASPNPAARRAALPSLTGLRFLAALLVFCFHATLFDSPIPPNDPINPFADEALARGLEQLFSKAGYLGVSFFFVLSGFVLTWSSVEGEPMRAFWRRRVLKIFPNHVVVFAAAMLLFAGATTPLSGWLPNLLLLHSYSPDPAVYVNVNPPAWTLCSELLFYLLFPLIVKPVRRIADDRLWLWAGGTVLGMIAVQVVNLTLVPDAPKSPITPISSAQFWFGYVFPVPRLFEFVLGMLLATAVIRGVAPRISPLVAALSVPVGYAAALALPFVFGFAVATIVPVSLVILAWAGADVAGRPSGLRGRVAVWLGEVSFGFYLCQGVVVFYGRTLLPPGPFGPVAAIGVVLALFAGALLVGWALFALVERPVMRRWARPRARRPARVNPVPSAV